MHSTNYTLLYLVIVRAKYLHKTNISILIRKNLRFKNRKPEQNRVQIVVEDLIWSSLKFFKTKIFLSSLILVSD